MDEDGIIPARAGFTKPRPTGPDYRPDHPRSRGVYQEAQREEHRLLGSSPLARGLPARRARSTGLPGIIPARAGFTAVLIPEQAPRADHPRSRGVYSEPRRSSLPGLGSSPLARGLLLACEETIGITRIIPARAGFTYWESDDPITAPDHPRSRGVYVCEAYSTGYPLGSSPLARGLHPRPSPNPSSGRIIPARAGFTGKRICTATLSQDHPRSRGVYLGLAVRHAGGLGSSPLARGLQDT